MEKSKLEIKAQARKLTVLKTPITPSMELWQALQTLASSTRKEKEGVEKKYRRLIIGFCDHLFSLKKIIVDQLDKKPNKETEELIAQLQILTGGGEEMLSPFSVEMKSFDGELWSKIDHMYVEVFDYLPHQSRQEVQVTETLSPAVFFEGLLLRKAKVIITGPERPQVIDDRH